MNINIVSILIGIIGVLFGVIGFKSKKLNDQKLRAEINNATVAAAEKKIQEVEDVQKKIKQLEAGTTSPEVVPPAPAGDSSSRIKRLNKLFNSKDN